MPINACFVYIQFYLLHINYGDTMKPKYDQIGIEELQQKNVKINTDHEL